MSRLFSPLVVNGIEFKNRAWVSPMCQYSAHDGVVGDWHVVHLGALAAGGAGLVMAEATGVSPEARISVGCPGLWNAEQVAAWRRIVEFAHGQSTAIGIQLGHAGRKGSTMRPTDDHLMASANEGGWTALAPSAIAFDGHDVPCEMDHAAIDKVVADFAAAAQRAVRCGFDVVEIHAAHGYLLHQFLSPLSNQRDDEYGGTLENRARLLLRVLDAVRASVGTSTPLFVRISATDYVEGGWDVAQSITLASWLREHGCDLLDVSSGGNIANAVIPIGPNYQVGFAAEIRAATGIATSAVGLITEPGQAEAILERGDADAVMMARALLRNPHWPHQAAKALGDVIDWPIQYDRARMLRHSAR